MKRFLALAAGGLGVGALLRRRRGRGRSAPLEPAGSAAEELRAKLAESRAAEAEAPAEAPPEPPESELDTRRRDVHDRAREQLDELS